MICHRIYNSDLFDALIQVCTFYMFCTSSFFGVELCMNHHHHHHLLESCVGQVTACHSRGPPAIPAVRHSRGSPRVRVRVGLGLGLWNGGPPEWRIEIIGQVKGLLTIFGVEIHRVDENLVQNMDK